MQTEALFLKTSNDLLGSRELDSRSRQVGAPGPNEIQVKPIYVGVCGTDIHLIKNLSTAPHKIPIEGLILGHEGVAQVVRVGSEVTHVKADDIVALESISCCYHCSPCRNGFFNQCENSQLLGCQFDGLFSQLTNIPASLSHNITAQCKTENDLIAYANLEPAAVAYHALENAKVAPGDNVLIFGGGPIGFFCALLAQRLFGVSQVFIREPLMLRRRFISSILGEANVKVLDLNDPLPICKFQRVIEASGSLDNINQCFDSLAPNSSVILLARSGESLHLKNIDHMITNNISISGSRGHLGGAYQRLITLQGCGSINLGQSVTCVLSSLSEVKTRLEKDPRFFENNMKVMIKINGLR